MVLNFLNSSTVSSSTVSSSTVSSSTVSSSTVFSVSGTTGEGAEVQHGATGREGSRREGVGVAGGSRREGAGVAGMLRTLEFSDREHQILAEELKHLDTAVTRARVHVPKP